MLLIVAIAVSLLVTLSDQQSSQEGQCQGRYVFNDTYGVVTNGDGDKYRENAQCEWLIQVPSSVSSGRFINLNFTSLETECSYDFVFVHDGPSYDSPLLGSFSGKKLPLQPLVAKSGHMLILLYSDTNFAMKGFRAEYSVTHCPLNCSSNQGLCKKSTGKCRCYGDWTGSDCSTPVCPDGCHTNLRRGNCSITRERCQCQPGVIGESCALKLDSNNCSWTLVTSGVEDFPPRAGHTSAYVMAIDAVVTFGGRDLNGALNDIVVFTLADGNHGWRRISQGRISAWPPSRSRHTMSLVGDFLFVFGGTLANNGVDDTLWAWDVFDEIWYHLPCLDGEEACPKAISDHTATSASVNHDKKNQIYFIGGRSAEDQFNPFIYKLIVESGSSGSRPKVRWENVNVVGGKVYDQRLAGHSAVYHEESESIVLFGGFRPRSARFTDRSGEMFIFNTKQNYWSVIANFDKGKERPSPRAYHSAVIIGNFIIMYGGNVHKHHEKEMEHCYDNQLHVYHYGCNTWVRLEDLELLGSSSQCMAFRGVKKHDLRRSVPSGTFSQSMVVVRGNILLIMAGYSGTMTNAVYAYTAPASLALNNASDWRGIDGTVDMNAVCENLGTSRQYCSKHPECGWCVGGSTAKCMHWTRGNQCRGVFSHDQCGGICSAYQDCYACVVHGAANCAWCVKDAECQRKGSPTGLCKKAGDPRDLDDIPGGGWWGLESASLTQVNQCQTNDLPAGLHWIHYRHPKDENKPDNVTIIRTTSVKFDTKTFPAREKNGSKKTYFTTEIRGWIHPLGAADAEGGAPSLSLSITDADTLLKLGTLSSKLQPMDVLANESRRQLSYDFDVPTRPDGSPIFPSTSPSTVRYFMTLEAKQEVKLERHAEVKLRWNRYHARTQKSELKTEFLEPYSSPNCSGRETCLACLTNSLCGWCPLSRTCFVRTDSRTLCSANENKTHLLVTDPNSCSLCGGYINCLDCTGDTGCEWLPDEAHCDRRGRFPAETISSPINCSSPCHARKSCTSCVEEEKNECVWCDSLSACFPFHMYTARFAFGQCRSWKDSQTWSYSESGTPVAVTENADENHCRTCEVMKTCEECLAAFTCGWCGNDDNPRNGLCVNGDFSGTSSALNCSALIGAYFPNATALDLVGKPASWSYAECPDVEECRLGLHDCHKNATCTNTRYGFNCTCRRGFAGDGRNLCEKTCFYDCVHGRCSNAPEYKCLCDIGWTGDSCDLDCGCNNHSTCETGIGVCDSCQNNTTGDRCELCTLGSFGNATDPLTGCHPCQCNGHQVDRQDYCEQSTGHCFCKDNTKGHHCDECRDGFYGDPRDGGLCYYECNGRLSLTNVSFGALGSGRSGGRSGVNGLLDSGADGSGSAAGGSGNEPTYCLWILTVYDSIVDAPAESANASISFSITEIRTKCNKGAFVVVYDGIPNYMQQHYSRERSVDYKLLGAFCGLSSSSSSPRVVVGSSGYLSIFFVANVAYSETTSGFNATFEVHRCPQSCGGNWMCDTGSKQCVCRPEWTGMNCDIESCPFNCSGHGSCHVASGFCRCAEDWTGLACNISVTKSSVTLERLPPFSSRVSQPPSLPLQIPSRRRSSLATHAPTDLSRMGHILVSCKVEYLWMYGGYNLNYGILNDTVRYDLTSKSWTLMANAVESSQESPASVGRYFHAAVCVPRENTIYLYGGMALKGGMSGPEVIDEFWRLNLDLQRWNVPPMERGSATVPKLAGHTLTLVNSSIILIGGFSPYNTSNTRVYVYDLHKAAWVVMDTNGSKPTGLYGHSAVHHSKSTAIYVFGGMEYQMDKSVITNRLYALTLNLSLDPPVGRWNLLPPEPSYEVMPRFFHAAVGLPDQMLVIGGRTDEEGDFRKDLLSYSYQCNKWRLLGPLDDDLVTPQSKAMWAQFGGSIAHRAALVDSSVYVMGGFDGQSRDALFRIRLPFDVCAIYSGDKDACVFSLGCSACKLTSNPNQTICYSNHLSMPSECSDHALQGVTCDLARLQTNAEKASGCERHRTCPHCLATFPVLGNRVPICQWCSNCPEGKCMLAGKNCSNEYNCRREQRVISNNNDCVEEFCQAPDCATCKSLKLSVRRNDDKSSCIWTRQFKRSSEVSRKLALTPMYDWNCVTRNLLEATPIIIESAPPQDCPKYCYEHPNCGDCVSSAGGEGGAQSCMWSELMQECMTPAYLPLHCANGECGRIIWGSPSSDPCPQPCARNKQCSTCLAQPGCGWCALLGLNGAGACMEGGVRGPASGICQPDRNISFGEDKVGLKALPDPVEFARMQAESSGGNWNYGECPAENECENNHHNCDKNQHCNDTLNGFECLCKKGYVKKGTQCTPVCEDGCSHGVCVSPNSCKCDFGYVGKSCATACQCHGNSECEDENNTSVCLKCFNNTTGSQCQYCEKHFVGDPTYSADDVNRRCQPCSEYCHSHSAVCVAREEYLNTYNPNRDRGPKPGDNPICLNCSGNTEGDKCQHCADGFFRHARDGPSATCKKCQCNGHGDHCNKLNGEDCICKNNTVTSCPSGGGSSEDGECWKNQCSRCREYFHGDPTNGHQCYRQMSVDDSICLSPNNVLSHDCRKSFQPGRSLFYFVQPKYLNVDIRVTIDVSQGAVDVYFSPFKDSFKVNMEASGHHIIELDRDSYTYDDEAGRVVTTSTTTTTTTTSTTTMVSTDENSTPSFAFPTFSSNAGIHRAKANKSILQQFEQFGWRREPRRKRSFEAGKITNFGGKQSRKGNTSSDFAPHHFSSASFSSKPFDTNRFFPKEVEAPLHSVGAQRLSDPASSSSSSSSSSSKSISRKRSHSDAASSLSHETTQLDEGVETSNAADGAEEDLTTETPKKRVTLLRRNAGRNLNTYVTLHDNRSILLVKDVRNRLVISLPLDVYDLRNARFYIAIVSKSHSHHNPEGAIGNLFFRQDQPHIDLFVFFSVFFSCFFLFLAICVVIWKFKQQVDIRRARLRAAIEMAHMRSRPFSRVNVVCASSLPPKASSYFGGGGGDKTPILSTADFSSYASYANQNGSTPSKHSQPQPVSQHPPSQQQQRAPTSTSSTPTKYGSLGGGTDQTNFSPSHIHHHNHLQHTAPVDKDPAIHHPIGSIPSLRHSPSELDGAGQGILPIALEPTDDGIAAVATVILELPRGSEVGDDFVGHRSGGHDVPPDRICLGSSLVMMRVLYPMLMSHAPGARSILIHRRRPSHPVS